MDEGVFLVIQNYLVYGNLNFGEFSLEGLEIAYLTLKI